MPLTQSQAAAEVRAKMCDLANEATDPTVYSIWRELIRATDPNKRMVLVRDKAAA